MIYIPATNDVTMECGDQMTFSVIVFPTGGTFSWTLDGSPSPGNLGKSYVFTAEVCGTHTLTVTYTYKTTIDKHTWTIHVNGVPVADAGEDIVICLSDMVQLDGSGSYDLCCPLVSYDWTIISKPAGSTAAVSNPFTPDKCGAYVLRLVVCDSSGKCSEDTVTITVICDCIPQIAAGWGHTVGIDTNGTNGTLWAWGYNDYGQLGVSYPNIKLVPTQIGTATDWNTVSTTGSHNLAIRGNSGSGGTLWAWGLNNYCQIGDGTTKDQHVPAQIGTDTDWVKVYTGNVHSVGIKNDGTLWAWGWNEYGQLGLGDSVDRCVPTQIGIDTDWVMAAAGWQHTVALKKNGTLWSTGSNSDGQLGASLPLERYVFEQIGSDHTWVTVVAGDRHTMALKIDGTLWGWGDNEYGELGNNGWPIDLYVPTPIGFDLWKKVDAGFHHTVGIKNDGTLWAWGWNEYGQLGDNSTTDRHVPTKVVTDNTGWGTITAGACHTLAALNISPPPPTWAWGYNGYGQLGNNTYVDSQVPIYIDWPKHP